eukprot:12389892-Prorocentrum_lima.AAC.1
MAAPASGPMPMLLAVPCAPGSFPLFGSLLPRFVQHCTTCFADVPCESALPAYATRLTLHRVLKLTLRTGSRSQPHSQQ